MNKEYLENIIRPYIRDISSISLSGGAGRHLVAYFNENFDSDKLDDVIFGICDLGEGSYHLESDNYDDVPHKPDYDSYGEPQAENLELVTVEDILTHEVVLYKEVVF